MTARFEHQPLYSNNPPKLTPRTIIWITPENILEYKFLDEIKNRFQKDEKFSCGWTGVNEDTLIISKLD